MKTYLLSIKYIQSFFLFISMVILVTLPEAITFFPNEIKGVTTGLYAAAHGSLFFVMSIRPLADIFRGVTWIRPLVILRKGVGVFSASIVVSFIIAKLMVDPQGYYESLKTLSYWSLNNLSLFAHAADISAVLLLITSNNLSKRLLGATWKRIQRLSYVYFYGSGIYVLAVLGNSNMAYYLATVTILTITAYIINGNRMRKLTLQHA